MNSNDIFVSLDIGTSNIKVIIGEMVDESLNIIGVGTAPSQGLNKGAIVDIDETVRSIKKAVEQAERMVGVQIESVIVGVGGNHIALQPCHGVVAVSSEDREIRNEDVIRVIEAAEVVSIPPEREIIDVIPRQFIVDGLDEINDPRGMIGVRLEMEGTIITGSKTILHNLLRCVEKAGLVIADICLQSIAAGSIALSRDERELGVALIDIGGGCTTISVFEEGYLRKTSVIPVGGEHITKDISVGLRISTEEAERVKLKHGHAFIDLSTDEEVFKVTRIGSAKEEEYNQFEIAHIIEARVTEMIEMVDKELEGLGYPNLPGGYVLTGGVASMPGVLELSQYILENNVRVASPDYLGVREPKYTVGVGLIQFTYRNVKIQGREVAAGISHELPPKPKKKVADQKKKRNDESNSNVVTKVKSFFGSFFD
ncbi:cell division protein FtsA [Pueribacillus sp. YX66]|uniref:cell division protein FtsA n=1 Tax=Pueribacillus sp. YX66 TaxID=3229242 RepID=UPI00358D14A1